MALLSLHLPFIANSSKINRRLVPDKRIIALAQQVYLKAAA
eukprot:CAMPEP_0172714122 /NCGR_PEP_ID=MMETSP1074-20121228/64796_1 /TAXON_ID=2916 /ORGANISM="Ceratium fusus, Strain PA161109" /LENGTH=40 /DNA_ID= /DNA_START= /DNA_END= /DNA_ORIENTATION=